jgi:hypothetical protein
VLSDAFWSKREQTLPWCVCARGNAESHFTTAHTLAAPTSTKSAEFHVVLASQVLMFG